MVSFASKVPIDSVSVPGVRFTVRRISQAVRARRDLEIIEPQIRIAELSERIRILREPYGSKEDEPVKEMPIDIRVEVTKLDREMGALINGQIKPASIRLGVVAIEGAQYDGEPGNVERLLEYGPDELIEEIWVAVQQHFGLPVDQLKNSQSPSISTDPERGGENCTTAIPAESKAIT